MKVGNFVYWRKCPGHLSQFARNQVIEVQGDRARLRFFATWCNIADLQIVEPTEAEESFCNLYHQPITNHWTDYDDW
ncbi:MAG: hypothetical protein J0L70_23160 [Leptolyngbya sp. UWPOB_LEPTO1]|uniref:hypothetical protein n=1 Tax=Leptolyngbya sp. UWPOB_LEPTO1 TaxID=2815653 RepID=UPI001AC325EF|nr:hypothetical protein [Leptolyngbya sp. UWPOB_LEPTO1]MBN8563440.1 hypothetical protein [Leptolyngbya sp. UWPOB_LEPTO1]